MGKVKGGILDAQFEHAYCTECGRAFAMDSPTVTESGAYCSGGAYHRDYGEPDAWIEGGDCPDCNRDGECPGTVYDGGWWYGTNSVKAMQIAWNALQGQHPLTQLKGVDLGS